MILLYGFKSPATGVGTGVAVFGISIGSTTLAIIAVVMIILSLTMIFVRRRKLDGRRP